MPKPGVRDRDPPGDAGGGTGFPEEEAITCGLWRAVGGGGGVVG